MKTINKHAVLLNKVQMKSITGGLCNPSPFYQQPCTTSLQCGGSPCAKTLYCYTAPGSSSGICLFR